MRRLLSAILILGFGTALLGCQQGVTDVGNPTINPKPPQVDPASPSSPSPSSIQPGPTLAQLIGGYALPTSAQSGTEDPNTSPNSPQASALQPCRVDSQRVQSIMSTMNPTQVILNYFLDYGSTTDHVLATYDSKTGAIAFTIGEPSVEIQSCTGTARASDASAITIAMTCKARSNDASDCQVTLSKK